MNNADAIIARLEKLRDDVSRKRFNGTDESRFVDGYIDGLAFARDELDAAIAEIRAMLAEPVTTPRKVCAKCGADLLPSGQCSVAAYLFPHPPAGEGEER